MIGLFIAAQLVATPANWPAQLAAAQPGDTVQFLGAFDHVALKARAFDPPLTLDMRQATLANLYLENDQGVTVQGGSFKAQAGDWKGAIYAVNFKRIHINGTSVDGSNGPGVTFRFGSDAVLDTATVVGAHNAVAMQGVDGFHVSNVAITGASGDGIDVFSSQHGFVGYSVCAAPRTVDASHKDCVQLADTLLGAPPTSDIEVAFNLAHGDLQGFTSFRPNPGHVRISIHDNTVIGSSSQGIALYDADAGSSVRNNHVWTLPGAANQTHVNVVGGAPSSCGNTEGPGGGKAAASAPACQVN